MIIKSPGDVAFDILGFHVYWYGILMGISILVGVFVAELISKYTKKGFFIEYAPLYLLVGLIGARLYYCLLNPLYYLSNPLEIFAIRHGGLSIHGMLIFGVILTWILAKRSNIKFFNLADVLACVMPLCQSIGRWGNFFNSEAFGLPTNQTWGLFIDTLNRPDRYMNRGLVHPTFLYESVLDFILFFVLLFMYKKSENSGVIFFWYLILYSTIRLFVEQLRADSALNVFGLPIAQLVSLFLLVIGIIGLYFISKRQD